MEIRPYRTIKRKKTKTIKVGNLRVGGEFIPKNYQSRVGESLKKGYISLQSEGHPVAFRNIKIRQIF